jgi:microsomal dipeptidase-like Zn-dependent dipeptidase
VQAIAARLRSAGFNQDDTEKIMGANFMRVFTEVTPHEGRSS